MHIISAFRIKFKVKYLNIKDVFVFITVYTPLREIVYQTLI
jgi:hypothetical protein